MVWRNGATCRKGLHAMSPDNMFVRGNARLCLACKRARESRKGYYQGYTLATRPQSQPKERCQYGHGRGDGWNKITFRRSRTRKAGVNQCSKCQSLWMQADRFVRLCIGLGREDLIANIQDDQVRHYAEHALVRVQQHKSERMASWSDGKESLRAANTLLRRMGVGGGRPNALLSQTLALKPERTSPARCRS